MGGEQLRISLITDGTSIRLRLSASCFPVGECKGLTQLSASLLLPSHLRTSLAEAIPDGRGESSPVYMKGGGGSAGLLSPVVAGGWDVILAHRQLPTRTRKLLAQLWVGSHQRQGIRCGWDHPAQKELPSRIPPKSPFCRTLPSSLLRNGDSGQVYTTQQSNGCRTRAGSSLAFGCAFGWCGWGHGHSVSLRQDVTSDMPGNSSPKQ